MKRNFLVNRPPFRPIKPLNVILFICIFFIINSYNNPSQAQGDGQPWCPEGATWLYQKTDSPDQEHLLWSYLKDTVLGNLPAKVLKVEHIGITSMEGLSFCGWTKEHSHYEY